MSKRLAKLGQAVAEVSDQAADPSGSIGVARQRLLRTRNPASQERFHRRARWVTAAGLGAACAVAAFLWGSKHAALSFDVGSPPEHGAVGEWIAAAPEAQLLHPRVRQPRGRG